MTFFDPRKEYVKIKIDSNNLDVSYNTFNFWFDGNQVCALRPTGNLALNEETLRWEHKELKEFWSNNYNGNNFWTWKDKIYFSNEYQRSFLTYILDTHEYKFGKPAWRSYFEASSLWTDGDNVFSHDKYIFDEATNKWNEASVKLPFIGQYWTDGKHAYTLGYDNYKHVNYKLDNDGWKKCNFNEFKNVNKIFTTGLATFSIADDGRIYELVGDEVELFDENAPRAKYVFAGTKEVYLIAQNDDIYIWGSDKYEGNPGKPLSLSTMVSRFCNATTENGKSLIADLPKEDHYISSFQCFIKEIEYLISIIEKKYSSSAQLEDIRKKVESASSFADADIILALLEQLVCSLTHKKITSWLQINQVFQDLLTKL